MVDFMVVSLKHFNYYKQNTFVFQPNMNLCSCSVKKKAKGKHLSYFSTLCLFQNSLHKTVVKFH